MGSTQPDSIEPLVSIIIRTKNEERWISSCLKSVFRQVYRNFEIILVDNMSTDQTVSKAREYPLTLVKIEKFTPGKAINDGIRASRGEYLVILSGHCVPANEHWLGNLVRNLEDPEIAGVYGRQEPLSFTSPLDKRDLIITFGLDRKVQVKDSFFHNANSALCREMWDRFPFDEDATNIEDRIWGKQVISAGLKIVYEPEASIYHQHGIHHDRDPDRADNIVHILETLEGKAPHLAESKLEDSNIVAFIPVKGPPKEAGGVTLLDTTIRHALDSRYINQVIVATDDEATADAARRMGAEVPFLRPETLSDDYVNISDVLRYMLEHIENDSDVRDLVVILEETHPFRPHGMIDNMILELLSEGMDSLVAAKEERRRLWISDAKGVLTDVGDPAFMPRRFKNHQAHIGLFGLGCVTHPNFIRDGNILGHKTGLYVVDEPFSMIEIKSQSEFENYAPILNSWLTMTSEPHRS